MDTTTTDKTDKQSSTQTTAKPSSSSTEISPITRWQIDPSHSRADFSVRHMMIAKVHGTFEKISGHLVFDANDPSRSTVDATIDTRSINTHDPQRDTHLKSADFFDVDQHPTITFKSKRVVPKGEGKLEVIGDLTIRGIAKEVVLHVEGPTSEMKDPWGNLRIGTEAKTKINRKDFGLHWNAALETGGFLVGDDVTISIDAQFVKQTS